MKCTDCTERVHDYIDGELAPGDSSEIEAHLRHCANCTATVDSMRALLAATRLLPRDVAPHHDLWSGIREQITAGQPLASLHSRQTHVGPEPILRWSRANAEKSILRWLAPLAVAAAAALFATVAERTLVPRSTAPAWSVSVVAGAPRVGAQPVRGEAKFHLGQWLETDTDSRAKVAVGSIGEVDVEPNSRLRLVGVAASNHRLELARGTMNAFIWAPPRLFFVETPSATAVDLGCSYTLTVDDAGNGELHVSSGYVALEDGARESIIGAGMRCFTRRGAGPGTPFAANASDEFHSALMRFDFDPSARATALVEVLALSRADDAATLWHLLGRTQGTQRAAVFNVLAKLAPPPNGVTREGILSDDTTMRAAWANALGLYRF